MNKQKKPQHFSYIRNQGAEEFIPHEFRTKLVHKRVKRPIILITPESYSDMCIIADSIGYNEVGWLGTVSQLGNEKFLIDKIYMPNQKVHGSTCELTEDGLGELFTDLAQSDYDACERMHFWGHVHPANSTSPSAQDEDQMKFFDHNDWFIRGIFGRLGRAEFTFFDYRNEVRWNDVPWQIHCPINESRRTHWENEIKDRVEEIPIAPVNRSFSKVSNTTNLNGGTSNDNS